MPDRELKVFRASVPDPEQVEALKQPFALEFTYPDGRTVAHTFTAIIDPDDASSNFAILAMQRIDQRGRQVVDLSSMVPFLEKCLPAEDYARLLMLLEDRGLRPRLEVFVEVFSWLVEEITGRPTMPSTRSSGGRSATGDSSTEPLSSAAST